MSAREDERNSTDTGLSQAEGAASSAGTGGTVASTCALHTGDPACYRMTPSSSGASSASVHYLIHGTWHTPSHEEIITPPVSVTAKMILSCNNSSVFISSYNQTFR